MYSPNTFHEICNFRDQIRKNKFPRNILSQKYIILSIINLANVKRSYAQKHRKRYVIFAFSACYFYTIRSSNVSEKRLSNYMIKSILNWLDLISTFKKWQTATIDKDGFTFSVVFSCFYEYIVYRALFSIQCCCSEIIHKKGMYSKKNKHLRKHLPDKSSLNNIETTLLTSVTLNLFD